MKLLKFSLFLFLLIFSFNFAYSLTSICCYNSGQSSIQPSIDTCGADIYVGDADSQGKCDSYNSFKLACIDSNGCSEILNDKYIFDLPNLANEKEFLSQFCSSPLVLYSTCTQTGTSTIGTNTSTNTGSTGSNSESNSGNFVPINESPNTADNLFTPHTESDPGITTCYNVGGAFGFFSDKNSCENTLDLRGNNCLYNPNSGGLISSYSGFINSNVLNFDVMEDSCISKSLVHNCYDYKTPDNCNLNKAEISDSCKWIESQTFTGNTLNQKSGICISNFTGQDIYFNKNQYSNRGNLILNPSFEEGISNWDGIISTKIKSSNNAFNGFKYYSLNNNIISQNISNIEGGKNYVPFVYVKYTNSLKNSEIKLSIEFYNEDGTLNSIKDYTQSLTSLNNKKEGIFEKMTFNSERSPLGNNLKVIFKLSTSGENIDVDAISYILESSSNVISSSEIFNPLQLISPQASNCNLCFEDNNFNTCTKEKSDLLGDCEYMVSNVGDAYDLSGLSVDYLGKPNNKYMFENIQSVTPSDNLKWKSQSLPKSQLFCNLYVNQTQCESPNNFINQNFKVFHPNSGDSLCKWNNQYGCFKDSNNDDLTDTFTKNDEINKPYINRRDQFFYGNFRTNSEFPPVLFNKESFDKSCDSLPPNSYIYFTGNDVNNSPIVISENYNNIVGNLVLHLNLEDLNLESCNDFLSENSMFLDIGINSKYFLKEYIGSQIESNLNMFDFLSNVLSYVDKNGEITLISDYKDFFNSDSSNNFSFITLDQSGNIGKELNFSFSNLDLNPPKINLTNYNYDSGTDWLDTSLIFGRNSTLNFSVTDLTNFQCEIKLNPKISSTNSNFYLSTGSFNKSNMTNGNFSFNIGDYIFNTSTNSQFYNLTISCTDIFGQSSSKSTIFLVDFDTSILILEPSQYVDSNSPSGFLNGPTNFEAISSEKNLDTCELINLNSDLKNTNLDIIKTGLGFEIPNMVGVKFYNNISGILDFNSQGLKNISIKCLDNSGNIFTEDRLYFYDTLNPQLLDYSLENVLYPNNSSLVYFDGNSYYTYKSGNEIKVNLSFNEVLSFNNAIQNLSAWNETSILDYFKNMRLTQNTYSSNIIISNFELPESYLGILQSEENLYLKKFSFIFEDMSRNKNLDNFSYYYDASIPKLNFSGEIINQDENTLRLYVNKNNPSIDLSFNSPNYRKYDCQIDLISGSTSRLEVSNISNYNFKLSDIISDPYLENQNVKLKVSCRDVYNLKLEKTYSFYFDNTSPILNSISLNDGENKIYKTNSLNMVYPDIIDNLEFNLENTNEVDYTCHYSFKPEFPNKFYFCDEQDRVVNFQTNGIQTIDNLVLLKGIDNINNNYICSRSSNFNSNIKIESLDVSKTLTTKLNISAYCEDKVGLRTQTKNLDLNIIYTPNDFISFDFDYNNKMAYAVVKSFIDYDYITIASDRNSIRTYDTIGKTNTIIGINGSYDIYEYRSSEGFSTIDFNEGDNLLFAVSPNKDNYLTSNLMVDNINPEASLFIPDETNNTIYTRNFWIELNAIDLGSRLSRVELFLDNSKIFSYDGNNLTYDNQRLNIPQESSISFTNSNSNFSNSVELINRIFNTSYLLRIDVYDNTNNLNSTSKNILIKDGMGLILYDSINSKVDSSKRFWLSKDISPIITFNTTKFVDSCIINPVVNNEWKNIYGNSLPIPITKSSGNNFVIDLQNDLQNFDLSLLNTNINLINISCFSEGIKYNYQRELNFINYLPDYVLTSSEGFVLNEEPFMTNLEVKSVGPYKYINCQYDNGNGYIDFPQKEDILFNENINFSNINTGIHEIKIKCSDIVGNLGPEKIYNFSINKDITLEISNVSILNNNINYISKPVSNNINDGTIYVSDLTNLQLEFKLNKKNDIICDYNLNSNSLFGLFSFVSNLFSIGTENIMSIESPYIYSSNNFNLDSNSNILNIKCLGTTETTEKNYNVEFLDNINLVSTWN